MIEITIPYKNNNQTEIKNYSMEIYNEGKEVAIDRTVALFLKEVEPNQVNKKGKIENIKED